MPLLPDERRLAVLIIANVMAIAVRELAFGEAPLRHELASLAAIYGEDPPGVARRDELLTAADRLNRRLAADLRRGAFDTDAARLAQVKTHLVAATLQKLRESNPRYLEAAGFA